MREVFYTVVSLSLSGALAALFLLALGPLYARRLSMGWRYYVWLIVLARFVLPIALPQGNLTEAALSALRPAQGVSDAVVVDIPVYTGAPDTAGLMPANAPATSADATPADRTFMDLAVEVLDMAWVLWLCIAMMQLVRLVTRYHSFARFIRAGWQPAEDPALLDALEDACQALHVRRRPALYINPLATSPMLVGVWRPVIVLPTARLSPDAARHVLVHEATHLRRGDILYKWVVNLVCCLHWFNPMVYWMRKEIGKACELACDEQVLARVDEAEAYGDTLLATADLSGRYGEPVAAVTMSEEGKMMKERLQAILRRHHRSAGSTLLAVTLTVTVLCAAIFAGVYTGYAEPAAAPRATFLPTGMPPTETKPPEPTRQPETGAEWGAAIGERIGGAVDKGVASWQEGMDHLSDWWAGFEEEMEQFAQEWEDYDWDAWLEEHVGEAGLGSSFQSGGRIVTNNAYYVSGYLVGLQYDTAFVPEEEARTLAVTQGPAEDCVVVYPERLGAALADEQALAAVQDAAARILASHYREGDSQAIRLTRLDGPYAEVTEDMLMRYYEEEDYGALMAMTAHAPDEARVRVFERACAEGDPASVAILKDCMPGRYDFDPMVRQAYEGHDPAVMYILLDKASEAVRQEVAKDYTF